MIYGYARVSATDQSLDRQLMLLREYISEERYIIVDKATGKDFKRKGYNTLVGTEETAPLLHEGDLLIVTSLDRLGRNYTEIKEQWSLITNTLKADIKILDMPLLDTSQTADTLDKKFMIDLVLQILSYTAQKERENIKERQKQGIAAARGKGKALGRPKIKYPENWNKIYSLWKDGKITGVQAMNELKMKRTTFYKLVKMVHDKDIILKP